MFFLCALYCVETVHVTCDAVHCFLLFKQNTAYEMRISDWSSDVCSSDLAARAGGVVLESEANWQAGARGADFQRRGTRFIYDDRNNLVRWEIGRASGRDRACQYV